MIVGIFYSKSVHLTKIANKIPSRACRVSQEQRLRRFLKNPAVRVRTWYRSTAQQLLETAATTREIHLIIDATKVSARYQLLIVTLAYRRRALPIAWTGVRHSPWTQFRPQATGPAPLCAHAPAPRRARDRGRR